MKTFDILAETSLDPGKLISKRRNVKKSLYQFA
jgi:hypothetical protein